MSSALSLCTQYPLQDIFSRLFLSKLVRINARAWHFLSAAECTPEQAQVTLLLPRAEHARATGSTGKCQYPRHCLFPTAQKMAQLLIKFLERELQPSCQVTCLESIRILSRDKHCLDPFTTKEGLKTLSRHAGIDYSEELIREVPDLDVILESLKCLCNIVFSSAMAQELTAEGRLVVGLARRIKLYNERSLPHDIKFFDLRLLFLLTALRVDIRQQLAQELRGISLMTDTLELTLGVKWLDPYEVATEEGLLPPLPRQETERAMEILKVLFNITFDSSKREVDEVRSLGPWHSRVSGLWLCRFSPPLHFLMSQTGPVHPQGGERLRCL